MRKSCLDYPVETVEGVFSEGSAVLADMLRKASGTEAPRVMLIADQNVVNQDAGLGTAIGRWVQANGITLAGPPFLLTCGERVKSDDMQSAREIARAVIAAKVGKGDVVLLIGGGTLFDVAGWAVAQVRGGVPVVRMPTTPVAMIDAAFSNYAAIDFASVKDALRVKAEPAGVVIDYAFAEKVLDGVWRAGIVTALRMAVVSDAAFVKKLVKIVPQYSRRDMATLKDLVEPAVAIWKKKGGTDFALWSAHRLEAMSGYKLPYGYALTIGMNIDTSYAVLKGAMPESERQVVCDALAASGAMEGAMHSRYLLERGDLVLQGLDAWKLLHGTSAITIPTGLGKSEVEENPDRETMKRAVDLLK